MTCTGLLESLRRAESARILRDIGKEMDDLFRIDFLINVIERLDGEKA